MSHSVDFALAFSRLLQAYEGLFVVSYSPIDLGCHTAICYQHRHDFIKVRR